MERELTQEKKNQDAAKRHAERFAPVEPVTLKKDEQMLQRKFEKHAQALTFVAFTTYSIRIGSQILKHSDTEMLFYLLVRTYRKRKKENQSTNIW